jgi:hypothetical protein
MALDSLHLLGESIFDPMTISRAMHCSPNLHRYAPGHEPHVPIPEDEEWFYRHTPQIQLVRNVKKEYQATAVSSLMIYENLRFDTRGRVTHVHPCMVYQLCKFFVSARNGSKIGRKDISESALYSGPRKMLRIKPIESITKRFMKLTTATLTPCKARGCQTPGSEIHPKSEYITGSPVCKGCMGRHFNGVKNWFSIVQIHSLFQEGFVNATVRWWADKPMRYILMGIILSKEGRLPLAKYERIGRLSIECPFDRILDEWPVDKRTLHSLGSIFGALTWRQINDTWKNYDRLGTNRAIGAAIATDQFRYFGWASLPSGSWAPVPELFGDPLKSIDDPANNTNDYPMRSFAVVDKKTRRVRYTIMRGSTYNVWRRLLTGSKVDIRATSLDYEPMMHETKHDAGEPMPFGRIHGDIAIYNAHHLSWGTLERYLTMLDKDATLYLYGSLKTSIGGSLTGISHGVFADILLTFRMLSSLDNGFMGYAVTTHNPGPELKGSTFEEDPNERHEVNLLINNAIAPKLPSGLARDPAWTGRYRLLALMKALDMQPLKGVVFEHSLLVSIIPKTPRKPGDS